MESLILMLPASWQPKAKAIVGAVGVALTVISGSVDHAPKWLTIALGVVTALGVYGTPAPGYVAPSDQTPGPNLTGV